jgi:hypothetical protein
MALAVTGEQVRSALARYIPAAAVDTCFEWVHKYRIKVRVKHSRQSKYGDYRPPQRGEGHVITINHDLNPYAFLITFTHEVAHLTTWLRYRDTVSPHGAEWKAEFRQLLKGFMHQHIFPDDVLEALQHSIQNPAASGCGDTGLTRALRRYDLKSEDWIHLEEVPFNAMFSIRNGQHFVKGARLRKNFECFEVRTRHKYFIHPLMEVKLISGS